MKIRPAWESVRITLNINTDGLDSVVIGSRDHETSDTCSMDAMNYFYV